MNKKTYRGVFLICLLLFTHIPVRADDLGFIMVGSINNQIPHASKVFFIKKGDCLCFYPIIIQGNKFYSTITKFIMDGKGYKVDQHINHINRQWFEINPVLKEYDNSGVNKTFPKVNLKPIIYQQKQYPSNNYINISRFINGKMGGTFYITPVIHWKNRILKLNKDTIFEDVSPLQELYPYQVVQIVCRPDDSYLGYLSELNNTPFILDPHHTPGGFHQTDYRVGSDCAAFAVYGKRRQGYNIPYCGPKRIIKYLTELKSSPLYPVKSKDGTIYLDIDGLPAKIGNNGLKPGDIIHFTEQVAVFYKDLGISGILDKDDLIFESYGNTPQITTIERSGFFYRSIRVFKWKM